MSPPVVDVKTDVSACRDAARRPARGGRGGTALSGGGADHGLAFLLVALLAGCSGPAPQGSSAGSAQTPPPPTSSSRKGLPLGTPGPGASATRVPVAEPARPQPPASLPAAQAAPSVQGSRVFIDRSGSMKGFAAASPASLESVHRAIINTLSAGGAVPIDFCSVGNKTECELPAEPKRFREARAYSARESRLAESIAPVPADQDALPGGGRRVSSVDERSVAVLVTDGLEAGSVQRRGDEPLFCVPGPDSFCLQRVLVARAKEGYGIWLLTISLPFKGRVYPERGLDKRLFERTSQHIAELRQQPAWRDIPLEVKGLRKDRHTGNHSYVYTGARPLMVFVLSRDHAAGRAVVQRLQEELSSARVASPAKWVRSLELFPQRATRYRFRQQGQGAGLARLGTDEAAQALLPVGTPRRDAEQRLEVRLECREGGAARLQMQAELGPGGAQKLPPELTQSLAVRVHPSTIPANAVIPPTKHPKALGAHVSGLRCLPFSTGTTAYEYHLVSTVSFDAARGTDKWWRRWTAANTYETPERVYRLAELVHSLLRQAVVNERVEDRIRVLVAKPD